jgi:6-phosphogluconolactonase
VSLSPDQWAFIGSYGRAEQGGIHIGVVAESGRDLRIVGSQAGVVNPSFLCIAPRIGCLYAVSETAGDSDGTAGHVHAFRLVDGGSAPQLTAINRRASGGDLPCHLAIDPAERWLAVSNYGTGSVAILPIGTDGELGDISDLVQHEGSGPNPERQLGPHAHCSVFLPGGEFLAAADLGTDSIVIYAFDDRTGSLRPHRVVRSPAGAGPRHLALHPHGTHLFVVEELGNRVVAHRWDADSGDLLPSGAASCLPQDAGHSIAADLHVSPQGRYVYASNRGHDSVAVIGFDDTAGLEQLAVFSTTGSWPRGFALSPDGSHLLVANQLGDEVVLLPVTGGGSGIDPPVVRARVHQPSCVSFWTGRTGGSSP